MTREETIQTLRASRALMLEYLKLRLEMDDMHGVNGIAYACEECDDGWKDL